MEEPRREPRVEVRAETRPEPRIEPRVEPRSEPRPEPRIEPKKLLEEAGLVMIETDRTKAAPVAVPQVDEPARLGRPRRERPRSTPEEDALQQVETKR